MERNGCAIISNQFGSPAIQFRTEFHSPPPEVVMISSRFDAERQWRRLLWKNLNCKSFETPSYFQFSSKEMKRIFIARRKYANTNNKITQGKRSMIKKNQYRSSIINWLNFGDNKESQIKTKYISNEKKIT